MSNMDQSIAAMLKRLEEPAFAGIPGAADGLRALPDFTTLKLRNNWETQAEMFMEGLKAQVEEFEAMLKPNQALVMICWHGHEKFEVLSISMPSHNVVALNCRDAEGEITQVTGHMNSVTFSFRILTAKEPVQRRKIGFEMPSLD